MDFTFKLGADPEFWLVDDKGKAVSAHDKVPGTKAAPYRLPFGAVQADGTAVEFNIHPAETEEEWVNHLDHTLMEIRKMVPMKYQFDFSPVRMYHGATWKKIPDEAKEIGCDPEQYLRAAFKRKIKEKARGIGGHIHIGWTQGRDVNDPQHIFDCRHMMRSIEQSAAAWGRILFDCREMRLKLTGYGKKDAHRIKPYGVEYRAWSSRWVQYPDLWPWIFKYFQRAFEMTRNGEFVLVPYDFNYVTACDRMGIDVPRFARWRG